jgi:sodium pump decarboxylase gamma subunit
LFGETVSLFESLQVTMLGMFVVFIILVLLMVIIKVMEKVVYKTPSNTAAPVKDTAPLNSTPAEVSRPAAASATDDGSDLELVAVIAAAVAANMGVEPSDLVIRNIVRMPETAPIWCLSGRSELMASRSMKH